MSVIKKHPYFSALAAGFLSAFSFAPLYLFVFFITALLLMWYILSEVQSYKKTALIAYLFGASHIGYQTRCLLTWQHSDGSILLPCLA